MQIKAPLIIGFFSIICISVVLWHKSSHSIVVVDMRQAITKPALLLSKSNLSALRQKSIITKYTALLPEVLQHYGVAHHATIISAQVLVSGNQLDITDEVIQKTLIRARHAT